MKATGMWTASLRIRKLSFCLPSVGRTRELFDFVETYARTGEPSPTTVLLMAAARRDFFLTVQHGQFYQGKPVIGYDLPGFGDELCGLPYLPRLIAKAAGQARRFHGG